MADTANYREMEPLPWFHTFCALFVLTLGRLYFRLTIEGREHIPEGGAVLAISNHGSNIDPPLVGAVLRKLRPRIMGKQDLWDSKALAWAMNRLGGFPVDRQAKADRFAYQHSLKVLKEGHALALFPEGARTKDGELQEFEAGAGRFAMVRDDIRILPMRIRGNWEAWGPGKKLPRPNKISRRIGAPFRVDELEGLPTDKKGLYEAITEEMFKRISQL